MRRIAATAATGASALLYALAFPATSWQPLAFVALVPFLLALRAVERGMALFLCWLWPVCASSFVADALPAAVETYFLQPPLQSYAFAIGVWTVTGSLYYVLFGLLYRGAVGVSPTALPLVAAAGWTACELLRGRLWTDSGVFIGNPWALIAYSQAGWHALVQVASVTGVYGVTFVLVAVNAALAEVALAAWQRTTLRAPLLGLGTAAAVVAGVLAFGGLALRGAPGVDAAGGVELAIVQGDVKLGSRWRSDFYGRNLGVYLKGTREAFTAGEPAVVFWPEGALTFLLEEEPTYQRAIGRLLAEGGAELLAGGPRQVEENGQAPRYFNSIFQIDGTGRLLGRYDKEYLVPFSEYFPLRAVDFLRRRFERVRVFEPGAPRAPIPTPAGRAGILVCNEAMLPEVAGRRVAAGAQILVSPSNDSWIRAEKWAEMMFDLVSLRAVEQRRWLVRASTSGPSAIVDPWGRVQARTEPFTRDVVLGRVQPRDEPSLYGRVGDAFGAACGLAALAVAGVGRARRGGSA